MVLVAHDLQHFNGSCLRYVCWIICEHVYIGCTCKYGLLNMPGFLEQLKLADYVQ